MADYKKVSKNIKRFDRARYAGAKVNTVANQSKNRVKKNTAPVQEDTPEEYANDRMFEYGTQATEDVAYYGNRISKKATENTVDNIKKYKIKKASREIEEKKAREVVNDVKVVDEPVAPNGSTRPQGSVKAPKTVNGNKVMNDTKNIEKTTQEASKKAYQATKNAKNAEKAGKAVKEGTKKTAEFIKKAAVATKNAVKAIIEGSKALVSAIIAGGWVSVIIIIVIVLVAAVGASVYGIFFSSEDNGNGMTINTVIQENNNDYEDEIDRIKTSNTYDTFEINGGRSNWKDVLAIYSVKTTTDPTSPQQVATVDENTKALLSKIFWDMNTITSSISTRTETRKKEETDEDGNKTTVTEEVTITVLDINITSKTASEMADKYNFTDEQKAYLNDLIDDKNNDLWNSLIFGLNLSGSNIDIGSLTFENEEADDVQKKIVAVATNSEAYSISARSGYCQAWVADVYQVFGTPMNYTWSCRNPLSNSPCNECSQCYERNLVKEKVYDDYGIEYNSVIDWVSQFESPYHPYEKELPIKELALLQAFLDLGGIREYQSCWSYVDPFGIERIASHIVNPGAIDNLSNCGKICKGLSFHGITEEGKRWEIFIRDDKKIFSTEFLPPFDVLNEKVKEMFVKYE